MRTKILTALKIITLAIVLSLGLSFVYAWTAPTMTPPGANVAAPINTGSTAQTKTGLFTAAGGIKVGAIGSACDSAFGGAIRWTGTRLEACSGTAWEALPGRSNSCDVTQISQSCTISVPYTYSYSCNCSKYGCSTCYATGYNNVAGKQYQAQFNCPNSTITTGWSSCN